MYIDPQSTLYVVASISIGILTIFLCVTLVYLILILRDASKVIENVRITVDKVNDFIIKPVSLASSIVDHVRPIIEGILVRATGGGGDDEEEKPKPKKKPKTR